MFIPPHIPADLSPNWQSYQIAVGPRSPLTRNQVMDRLHVMGIPTRRGVMASHLEPPYRACRADCRTQRRLAATTLQLPMHPALTVAQQDRVLAALEAVTAPPDTAAVGTQTNPAQE